MILSPLCAEYIIGYDTSTGDPVTMLGYLLIFSPLYGAPAILIRELSRRFGLGWPGIVALATAFGIVQAGIIDQSLFSESYRQIDYWESLIRNTWIAPLGISAFSAMVFLVGHTIWSFCIPIALVEALSPKTADRPWLGLPGMIVITLLYLGAAALVLFDHLENEVDHASMTQVIGSSLVVGLLAIFAFSGCRRRAPDRDFEVPKPLVVGVLGLIVAIGYSVMPEDWFGVAGGVAILAVGAAGIARLSRSTRWEQRHIIALSTGVLMARALFGFLIEPLGDVPPTAKYAHNVGFLLGAFLLGAWAMTRNQPEKITESESGKPMPE